MRIRSVKPEFWEREVVQTMPALTRLAYIQLWNLADDQGRLRASVPLLAAHLLPFDRVDKEEVLEPLVSTGRLRFYVVDDERYAWLPRFSRHQVIGRPSKSRLPAPPADAGALTEPSLSPHGAFTEPSLSLHGALTAPSLSLHGALTAPSLSLHGALTEPSLSPPCTVGTPVSTMAPSCDATPGVLAPGALTAPSLSLHGALTEPSLSPPCKNMQEQGTGSREQGAGSREQERAPARASGAPAPPPSFSRDDGMQSGPRPRDGSPDAYRAAWDAERNATLEKLVAAYNKLGRETSPSGVWAERPARALQAPLRHALLRFESMGATLGDTPEHACIRLLEWAANAPWRQYRKNGGGQVDLYQRPEAICGTAYEGGTGARQLAENWQRVLEWEAAEAATNYTPDAATAERWAREDAEARERRAAVEAGGEARP